MIRIRYRDLPEGLHAQAQAHGRRTTVYLRPGLTPRQRRESLRRTLRSGRMGYGPPVSAAGLAVATVADRIRTTLSNTVAAIRWHPLGAAFAAGACAVLLTGYAMLVSVSAHIIPGPVLQAVVPLPAVLRPIAAPPAASSPARHGRTPAGGPATPSRPGGGPSPTGSAGPSPTPSSSLSPSPSPTQPGPSPSPTLPSPSPAPSVCVTVGPIRVCL